MELPCRQQLEFQCVFPARLQRSADRLRPIPPRIDAACDVKQRFVGLGLQLVPELVRPTQQWHVLRRFEIGQPDDPRQSMGGTEHMRNGELLQAEHLQAATCQVVHRGASHAPQTDNDGVEHDRIVSSVARSRSATKSDLSAAGPQRVRKQGCTWLVLRLGPTGLRPPQ